jgi:hypothetical protein
MSLYQKASLVQIPSGYKASADKLYSVVPSNGDGDFTVDSSPLSTRVNKDGLIESVVADQARLNYDLTNPQDPHLLLEPTRTNILLTTTDVDIFDNRANITDTPNTTTAPDGSLTADTLSIAASGSSFLYDNITVTASTEYAFSFYVKNINFTGSQGLYAIYNNSGSSFIVQNVAYNITSEWVRITGTFTTPSGCTSIRVYPFRNGIGTGEFSIWGWQLEAGTYATSLIPTASSTVTRTVDFVSGGGDANLFNDSEGTLFVEAKVPDNNTSVISVINISDGTLANRVLFQWGGALNRLRTYLVVSSRLFKNSRQI